MKIHHRAGNLLLACFSPGFPNHEIGETSFARQAFIGSVRAGRRPWAFGHVWVSHELDGTVWIVFGSARGRTRFHRHVRHFAELTLT